MKIIPEEFIRKSFEFLLEMESKDSILRQFNISQINDFFPEYEKEIKKMLELSILMGKAQMMTELENRVVELSKKNQEYLNQQTGVEPSLTEEDAKQYLELVINEIESVRGKHETT